MDYSMAQDLFLSSSRPLSALEMRRDLLHWDQALKLATTLSPAAVPEISVEYAQQLEFKGEYENGLKMYESALNSMDDEGNLLATDAQQTICMGGIARCTLRLGDLRRGVRLARESNDKKLCRECAAILSVGASTRMEAASLYEIGEQYEKAAEIYIKQKDFTQASKLMGRVTLPKLHSMYGKACEQAGKFQDAATAYKKGENERGAKRRADNVCVGNGNHMRSYLRTRRAPSPATAMILIPHPNPFRDSLRSSQPTTWTASSGSAWISSTSLTGRSSLLGRVGAARALQWLPSTARRATTLGVRLR